MKIDLTKALCAESAGVRINVHAQPGAKKTALVGTHGDAVKIRVQAPPIDGRANEELVRYLAEVFETSRANIRLTRGETSRAKSFIIDGVGLARAEERLRAILA